MPSSSFLYFCFGVLEFFVQIWSWFGSIALRCRKERKGFGKRTLSEFYVNFASEIFPNRAFPKISDSFPNVPVTRSLFQNVEELLNLKNILF